MIVIGPLIGLVCALGIAGLVAGRLLGSAILRKQRGTIPGPLTT